MDVRLPDGTVVQNVPEGTTQTDLMARVAKMPKNTFAAVKSEGNVVKPPPMFTPSGEKPLPSITDPEMIAANPVMRAAMNAAEPFMGLMQRVDEAASGGKKGVWSQHLEELNKIRQKGQEFVAEHDPTGDITGKVMGGAGVVASPVYLKAAKAVPLAESTMGRVGQGTGLGAAAGLATPVYGDNRLEQVGANTALGAGMGGALPLAAPAVVSGGAKAWDALSGRLPSIAAGKIARDSAGADLPAIRTATAQSGETATRAAAHVKNDVWDALGEFAARHDKSSYFSREAEARKQVLIHRLGQIAGGRTQTSAQQAADDAHKALNVAMTPARETELAAANAAGTTGRRLQAEADALFEAASSKVADVRRIGKAGEIAERVGAEQPRLGGGAPPVAGLPRTPARYSYGTELSQLADRIATVPAADSLILGQAARFKQMQADSLAAHGLQPLDGGSIIRSLSRKIADPKIGSETLKEKVLSNVRERFQQWTDADGIIDASAIYGIRKSAVNDAIEQLLGASDPKSKSKAAAGILAEVKPLIDNAIIKAGGRGWVENYLKPFEEGMHKIDQQKMGAKALELLKDSPKRLVKLSEGDKPDMVRRIFQNEFDLNRAMGDKARPIHDVASSLARDLSIKEGAGRGAGGLARVLEEHASKFKFWNVLDPKVAIVNRALAEFEGKINKKTIDALVEGLKTGRSANELMNTLPTSERLKLDAIIKQLSLPATGGGISALQEQR